MQRVKKLFRHRDFLLFLALGLGLIGGEGARWSEKIVLPALAMVMTLSTMGVAGSVFRSARDLVIPALAGVAMNYGVLGGLLFGLNALLIREEAFWTGLIIMVAVPPAVAVIPFTSLLEGNSTFSLIGTTACYLAALVITPLIALRFLGSSFVDPGRLTMIMVELILIPLIFSRILLWTGVSRRIEPLKGAVTNWCFFVVVYTIVGLNRKVLLDQTLSLVSVAAVAVISTFLLGVVIEGVGRLFKVEPKTVTSLVLLGTHKNTGLAAGLALSLFSEKTAVPATVSTIFMIVYFIWLSLKRRWSK